MWRYCDFKQVRPNCRPLFRRAGSVVVLRHNGRHSLESEHVQRKTSDQANYNTQVNFELVKKYILLFIFCK